MDTKPILFNTEMVQAIRENRKTVTRRVVKPQPEPDCAAVRGMYRDSNGRLCAICHSCAGGIHAVHPPCDRGDILWVRETWNCLPIPEPLRGTSKTYWYKADGAEPGDKWRPSIHMPREAARIFLRVTDVRVERLQEITSQQIDAEGCCEYAYDATTGKPAPSGPSWFRIMWEKTIKPADLPSYGWEANPWVWVIEFERISEEEVTDGT